VDPKGWEAVDGNVIDDGKRKRVEEELMERKVPENLKNGKKLFCDLLGDEENKAAVDEPEEEEVKQREKAIGEKGDDGGEIKSNSQRLEINNKDVAIDGSIERGISAETFAFLEDELTFILDRVKSRNLGGDVTKVISLTSQLKEELSKLETLHSQKNKHHSKKTAVLTPSSLKTTSSVSSQQTLNEFEVFEIADEDFFEELKTLPEPPQVTIEQQTEINSRLENLNQFEETRFESSLLNPDLTHVLKTGEYNIDPLEEFKCLAHNKCLRDFAVNYYIELLNERQAEALKERQSKFFSSIFFSYLAVRDGYNYKAVERWTNGKHHLDTFQLDKIIIPIFTPGHWTLAVVFVQRKLINFYNSLARSGRPICLHILHWLRDEAVIHKKNLEFDEKEWTLADAYAPDQGRTLNCGVHILLNISLIADDLPLSYTQDQVLIFRKRIGLAILDGKIQYSSSQLNEDVLMHQGNEENDSSKPFEPASQLASGESESSTLQNDNPLHIPDDQECSNQGSEHGPCEHVPDASNNEDDFLDPYYDQEISDDSDAKERKKKKTGNACKDYKALKMKSDKFKAEKRAAKERKKQQDREFLTDFLNSMKEKNS
jgi:Ulp1 protease family, C-terminal catalytic domain